MRDTLRSILLPLDGSRLAEEALPFAVSLADRTGAALHLVTVHVPIPRGAISESDPDWDSDYRDRQAAYVKEVADRLEQGGQPRPRAELREGEAADELVAYIGEADIDLVVLATHGRGGVERAWLGSVADRLVRRMTVPLLVIPARERDEPAAADSTGFRHVLIPLDGSRLSERMIEPAFAIGSLYDADYTLLRVVTLPLPAGSPYPVGPVRAAADIERRALVDAEADLERLAGTLRERGADARVRVIHHHAPARTILETQREEGADLIALATHGRGGLSRVLLGSIADKVIRRSDCPVLVEKPPES